MNNQLHKNKMDMAIIRIEQFRRAELDFDSYIACIHYVEKTSGYSYQELVEKMRLDCKNNLL